MIESNEYALESSRIGAVASISIQNCNDITRIYVLAIPD